MCWSSLALTALVGRGFPACQPGTDNVQLRRRHRLTYTLYRGLEADQKVIAAHGCYAMTATTALTAQNTQGVDDIHYTPPDFVRKQIDASISDIGVDVVKTGILSLIEGGP